MKKESILIFEFASGGGFSQVNIPISLLCEGFGMLNSIITDFKLLDFEIFTLLDFRIFDLSRFLLADNIIQINNNENYLRKFKISLDKCNYVFIIAPESSNILYKLTKFVKKFDKILLSTNLEGIVLGSSKLNTYYFFKSSKMRTPKTYKIPLSGGKLDQDFIFQKFDKLKSPIVIKPEDGVGAESIYYFETHDQILKFFHEYKNILNDNRTYIIQEFIGGSDLSASLIGFTNTINSHISIPLILSINSQDINLQNPNYKSEYFGGYTPVKNHKEITLELELMFKKIDFSAFRGYFGIDFIHREKSEYHFIEINPRLTTSYIGLRNVINLNPANLILDSKLDCLESPDVKHLKFSLFSRMEFLYNESEINNEDMKQYLNKLVRKVPEFITPPISMGVSNQFTSFIATKTDNLFSSRKKVEEIIQSMKSFNFKILR
ncbi:MAG: ATP-grasp domain-containing protein [Promethearchaeota archaeon]